MLIILPRIFVILLNLSDVHRADPILISPFIYLRVLLKTRLMKQSFSGGFLLAFRHGVIFQYLQIIHYRSFGVSTDSEVLA